MDSFCDRYIGYMTSWVHHYWLSPTELERRCTELGDYSHWAEDQQHTSGCRLSEVVCHWKRYTFKARPQEKLQSGAVCVG